MEYRQNLLGSLVSPQPRRLHVEIKGCKKNPFQKKQLPLIRGTHSNGDEDERVLRELSSILAKPACLLPPIGKKSPSPTLLPKFKLPSRTKANPIVKDEVFMELNSTASTFVSEEL